MNKYEQEQYAFFQALLKMLNGETLKNEEWNASPAALKQRERFTDIVPLACDIVSKKNHKHKASAQKLKQLWEKDLVHVIGAYVVDYGKMNYYNRSVYAYEITLDFEEDVDGVKQYHELCSGIELSLGQLLFLES